MARFHYEAYTKSGASDNGEIEADSITRAREILQGRGLLVLNLAAGKQKEALVKKELQFRKPKVKTADVAWLSRQLATTQAAGLPVFRALSMLGRQKEGTAIGTVIDQIHEDMGNGRQLSRAMAEHEDDLGTLSVSMVEAGEASGTLGEALSRLADIVETRLRLKRKIKSAMAYPVAMLVLIVGLFFAMLFFVAPTFAGLYDQIDGELPRVTSLLLSFSDLLKRVWFLVPLVPVGLVYGFKQFKASHSGKIFIENLTLRLPVIGRLVRLVTVSRIASTLASALAAGVPLLDALDLAGQVSNNSRYLKAIERAKEDVRDGRPLYASLGNSPEIPELMVRLVEVGEDTGALPELLERYAMGLQEEVEAAVDSLTSLLEPLLIVILGVTVGGMLVALYLPMFGIVEQIGN